MKTVQKEQLTKKDAERVVTAFRALAAVGSGKSQSILYPDRISMRVTTAIVELVELEPEVRKVLT